MTYNEGMVFNRLVTDRSRKLSAFQKIITDTGHNWYELSSPRSHKTTKRGYLIKENIYAMT